MFVKSVRIVVAFCTCTTKHANCLHVCNARCKLVQSAGNKTHSCTHNRASPTQPPNASAAQKMPAAPLHTQPAALHAAPCCATQALPSRQAGPASCKTHARLMRQRGCGRRGRRRMRLRRMRRCKAAGKRRRRRRSCCCDLRRACGRGGMKGARDWGRFVCMNWGWARGSDRLK